MANVKEVNLTDLHFEHKLWNNELSFFADETVIYEHRLEELVRQPHEREMLPQLEHFQNQFIRQKEVIDTLQHDINAYEHRLTLHAEANRESTEELFFKDHTELRERMESFRSIYTDLKKRFLQFMERWM